MKKSIVLFTSLLLLFSCSKENITTIHSVGISENLYEYSIVNFDTLNVQPSKNRLISRYNVYQKLFSDSVYLISGSANVNSLQFMVNSTVSETISFSNFRFILNGKKLPATISYEFGVITVALNDISLLPGANFINLKAEVFGVAQATYSVTLIGASITDNVGFNAIKNGLPLTTAITKFN